MPSPLDIPRQRLAPAEPSLADVVYARTAVARATEFAVRKLRLANVSWSKIAADLGVTKQAAWRKYSYVDDFPVALCMTDGVAYARCTMTGAEFRDPKELKAAARAQLLGVLEGEVVR